jgi:hypothetical protein
VLFEVSPFCRLSLVVLGLYLSNQKDVYERGMVTDEEKMDETLAPIVLSDLRELPGCLD